MNMTFLQLLLTLMLVVNLAVILRALYKHYWLKEARRDAGEASYHTYCGLDDKAESRGSWADGQATEIAGCSRHSLEAR